MDPLLPMPERREMRCDARSPAPAATRWRRIVGPAAESGRPLDVRQVAQGEAVIDPLSDDDVLIVAPETGEVTVKARNLNRTIVRGDLAIIALGPSAHVIAGSAGRAVCVRLSRTTIQIIASSAAERPCIMRRLSTVCRISSADTVLHAIARRDERGLHQALDAILSDADFAPRSWVPARPLGRAIDNLLAVRGGPHDLDGIARRNGLTRRTLQRGVQACTGISLNEFAVRARLEAVRTSLSSARESRSMDAIARDHGFGRTATLVRRYRDRFGESPSATREHTVKNANLCRQS